MAYPLPERDNPYLSLIKNRFGLVWNIIEGPILLRYNLVAQYKKGNKYSLFDNTNFRGYLSFKELALRIYAANFAVGICPHFLVEENETLLLNFFELMKTEDFSTNKRLLISEGQKWLFDKYGITNRWAFETIVRLLYEEFFHVNPEYCSLRI
jgi:hypothetical protein